MEERNDKTEIGNECTINRDTYKLIVDKRMIQNEEVESDLFSFFQAAAFELNFSSWANH